MLRSCWLSVMLRGAQQRLQAAAMEEAATAAATVVGKVAVERAEA